MKKYLKKILSIGLILTLLVGSIPVASASKFVNFDSQEKQELMVENPAYYTKEGKSLSQYDISTVTTIDGMNISTFWDEDGNIVASMTEDEEYLVIAYTDGRMFTFPKDANGNIAFSSIKETRTALQYPLETDNAEQSIVPYARKTFHSNFFPDDGYTYYSELDVWHLYYGDDYAYSGDNPSSKILNKCEDFSDSIHSMDDHLYDAAETITGYVPGVSVAMALARLVQDVSWSNAAELVAQLVLLIPQLGGVSTAINTGVLFGHMLGATSDHSAYKDDFEYVRDHA